VCYSAVIVTPWICWSGIHEEKVFFNVVFQPLIIDQFGCANHVMVILENFCFGIISKLLRQLD
jgi:hypothetical protein